MPVAVVDAGIDLLQRVRVALLGFVEPRLVGEPGSIAAICDDEDTVAVTVREGSQSGMPDDPVHAPARKDGVPRMVVMGEPARVAIEVYLREGRPARTVTA